MSLENESAVGIATNVRSERGASLRDAKARVPKNVIFNFIGYSINIAIAFLISPFLVHRLGPTAYGIWGLIGEILGYSFLLDFGIRVAVTRYVGRHLALDEPDQISSVLTTGLIVTSISASLVLIGGVIAAYFLPRFFAIPASMVTDARASVVVVSAAFAASFPGNLFTGCVAALSRYDLLNIRNVAPALFRGTLLWLFLERGHGLLSVAVITGLAVLLSHLLDIYFASTHLPQFNIAWRFFDTKTLRTLLTFSFYVFLLSMSARVLFMSDNIVVGYVLGPAVVTIYSVGMIVPDQLRSALSNINVLFAPLASQMDALSETDSLQSIFYRGPKLTLVCVLAGVGAGLALGPRFLGLWMGNSFADQSGPVLRVLAGEVVCFAMACVCVQLLYGMNRHRAYAWMSLSQATANFTLSVLFIRRMGPVGVAWGTLVPALLVESVILPAYTARVLDLSMRRFYLQTILRPLLSAIPYTCWLFFLSTEGLVRGYFSFAMAVCSGLLLYGPIAWLFAFDNYDRELMSQSISNVIPRLRKVATVSSSTASSIANAHGNPVRSRSALAKTADFKAALSASVHEHCRAMHILSVAKYPLGGIRTYLKYTYGQLEPAKYKFTIAVMESSESSLIPSDLSDFELEFLESDVSLGTRGLFHLTRNTLRHQTFDLIHSQGLTAGLLTILANWRRRVPHVITSHDVFREDQFRGWGGHLQRYVMAALLPRADLIVCVTEDARQNFLEFLPWFPADKLVVVPNGICMKPLMQISEKRRACYLRNRRPDAPFTFAFLGRFMPQKGFDILVDAVAELVRNGSETPPFRILAINQGDRIGRYKKKIHEEELEPFFEFCSFRPSVTETLANVDAVVMPSRWEAAGLVAMEALSAGCPLIATDCVGLREVVAGSPALISTAGDARSLAQQMKTAMGCQNELQAAFCDYASTARRDFDVSRTASAMDKIFSQLVPFWGMNI